MTINDEHLVLIQVEYESIFPSIQYVDMFQSTPHT